MFSTSSGHLSSFLHSHRSNRQGRLGTGDGNRDVGGSHLEPVDGVGDVVGGLEHTIGINILVAASGHAKSITCLLSGRVDVFIAKAHLTELVLGVELAGSDRGDGSDDWGNCCYRGDSSCLRHRSKCGDRSYMSSRGDKGGWDVNRGCNRDSNRGCGMVEKSGWMLHGMDRNWDLDRDGLFDYNLDRCCGNTIFCFQGNRGNTEENCRQNNQIFHAEIVPRL